MTFKEEKLNSLARLFSPYATLYAVGGYVRDGLMGIDSKDIDVCSELNVEDVKKILSNTEFAVSDRNLRMGTVIISSKDFKAEYTSFRVDSYDTSSGLHTPEEVRFTQDMSLDAKRRDFKCNALYLDPLSGEISDFTGGREDIKKRVLSTADDPDKVFEADGLRILRLVRFYAELGYSVEKRTLVSAKKNAWRVKDIAAERVREELNGIFTADIRYPELGLSDAHLRGFRFLDELGLVDLLLPELSELKGLKQPERYHLYDAYEHSLQAFKNSDPRIRWAALFHDVGKARAVALKGNMHGHAQIGAEIADEILKRLKFSNEERKRVCKLIELHMTDINGNTSENKLRWFAAKNSGYIGDLLDLMDADGIASLGALRRENRVRTAYEGLLKDGSPLSVKQLKANGRDLIELGADEKSRGTLLEELWRDTVMNPDLNEREKTLSYLKKKIDNGDEL